MRWIAVALGVLLGLALGELGLRAARFEYQLLPTLQFGFPDPISIRRYYKTDPDLIWIKPDFAEKLIRARRTHPSIIFLGDSCTELSNYPERALAHLRPVRPDLATGIKFSASGWSSEQGLTLLRRDILALKPRIVTIYFGWNDHWVAFGPTDSDLTEARRLFWLSERSRLAQVVLKARLGWVPPMAERVNRVPLARYRENLNSMIRESRKAGIEPILITAPSNFVQGQEPEYLKLRHVRSLAELVPLHTAYVRATREAALEERAPLCDAALAFEKLPPPLSAYFKSDGIHFSASGTEEMGSLVSNCILDAASRTPPVS